MNILAIGHSVLDTIYDLDDSKIIATKPGGIFYAALIFKNLLGNNDTLTLVSSKDKTFKKYFATTYSKFDLSFMQNVKNIPNVVLTLKSNSERKEDYKYFPKPLSIVKIKDLNFYTAIYINMISGNDLSLNDLILIRRKFKGLIYIDIHTLSRGIDKNGKRFFRQVPNYKTWLNNVDMVQVNKQEFFTITKFKTKKSALNEIFSTGIRILLLTKDSRGAEIFYKENSKIIKINFPALKTKVQNHVGCGDVFGATFFYFYNKTKNINLALGKATKAAGLATTFLTADDYQVLRKELIY